MPGTKHRLATTMRELEGLPDSLNMFYICQQLCNNKYRTVVIILKQGLQTMETVKFVFSDYHCFPTHCKSFKRKLNHFTRTSLIKGSLKFCKKKCLNKSCCCKFA